MRRMLPTRTISYVTVVMKDVMVRRKLGDSELDEQACRGCMRFLDSIRLFSIPFVQLSSHKGCIRWAISLSDFVEHKTLLTFDPTDIDTIRDGYIESRFRKV